MIQPCYFVIAQVARCLLPHGNNIQCPNGKWMESGCLATEITRVTSHDVVLLVFLKNVSNPERTEAE